MDIRPFLILLLTTVVLALFPPRGFGKILTSMADIAEKAIPGVVNIRTTTYVNKKDPQLDLYQFFLKGTIPKSSSTHAVGSGVVIDREGHILTNYHVIEQANVIEVLFAKSKRKVRAKVVGTDPKTDLALLLVKPVPQMTSLDLGDSDSLRVGDLVLAIGNPFGYAHTVTSGIISAKGRVIGTGPYDDFLQTDAPIHPGNSGGPLIDIRGRVIGINTAVSSEGPGIGFATPINLARKIVGELKKFGNVRRPFLGIVGQNILSLDEVDTGEKDGQIYGVLIQNLIVDGPGHKSGLAIGDLLMVFDNEKIVDMNHAQKFLTGKKSKEKIKIQYYRRGKGFMTTQAVLEDTPEAQDLPVGKDLF